MLQRKYLISAKWWRQWKEFVNFDAKESSSDGKANVLFKPHFCKRPGPIANRCLIVESINDPSAAEFELDLKPNLLEHHDFEALNKRVFDLLVSWYGCDYEVYRVLKPDPLQTNKLFLDLYPSKLSSHVIDTYQYT